MFLELFPGKPGVGDITTIIVMFIIAVVITLRALIGLPMYRFM